MTTCMLESKLRTLLNAYKAAKDNERQTGASPCPPPYMEEMDAIFGDRAHICSVNSIELGFRALPAQNLTASVDSNTSQSTLQE